jgi:hypothetical protein
MLIERAAVRTLRLAQIDSKILAGGRVAAPWLHTFGPS